MWRLFEPWIKVVKTVQGPGFYPSSSFVALSMPASRDRAEDPSVWSRPATNYKEASSLQTFRTVLSPGQPGRNAAWKGQTSAHPEIDNEQKKKDFMPKMPPSRKHFTEAHGNLCNNTITCCMCSCFNNHTVTLCLHPQSGLQGTSLQPPPWKFSKNVAKLLVTDMKSYIKSVMISDAIHVALTSWSCAHVQLLHPECAVMFGVNQG